MRIVGFSDTVRRNLYWTRDRIINKGKIYSQYIDIKSVLEDHTQGKNTLKLYLENLLKFASSYSSFYKRYRGCSLQEYPVINKMILNQHRSSVLTSSFTNQELHIMTTSGSTGVPFSVQQDKQKRNRVLAELKVFGERAGYLSHEKMVQIHSYRNKEHSWWKQFSENIWRFSVSVQDPEHLEAVRQFLKSRKPVALYASACDLPGVFAYLEEQRDKPEDFYIRTVITGGEMVPASLRMQAKNIFGNKCNIIVRYSNEEMGVLGQDNGLDTFYDLNWGSYYFEFLKMDSDEPAEPGELARIIVTDLFNYAFPLIRYDTGDCGTFSIQTGKWPVLETLSGKTRDILYDTIGNRIPGSVFTNYLKDLHNVVQWQIIQETKKDYILRFNGSPNDAQRALKILHKLLGKDASIKLEMTDEIPVLSSGKRQYTICKIKK